MGLPRLATTAVGIVLVTLLAACGGSTQTTPGSGVSASPARGSEAGPTTAGEVTGGAEPASRSHPHRTPHAGARRSAGAGTGHKTLRHAEDPVSRHDRPARVARPKSKASSEVRRTGPLGVDPCGLVSRAQARAIVGGAVSKPQLGLQGPTCIYETPRTRQPITVALQQLSLAAATKAARNVIHTDVSGRRAVCMDYGGVKLLVPLTTGSVLVVGAPCPVAQHLAATALRRLP